MVIIIGVITVLGVITGIYALIKTNKIKGIFQIILAIVCPILTALFCSLKDDYAFGGTDWQFIVHSATIDTTPAPWIILILFALEVVFIIRYFQFHMKKNQEER